MNGRQTAAGEGRRAGDLCPLWDRGKRSRSWILTFIVFGRGKARRQVLDRVGGCLLPRETKAEYVLLREVELPACGKTGKDGGQNDMGLSGCEEGWDEVNPVFKRKLKAIYDTAHDIQLTATSIYDLELGQLYQQCHLIKS